MKKIKVSYNVGTAWMLNSIIQVEDPEDIESVIKTMIDNGFGWMKEVDEISSEEFDEFEDDDQWVYIDNTDSDVESKKECYFYFISHFKIEDIEE